MAIFPNFYGPLFRLTLWTGVGPRPTKFEVRNFTSFWVNIGANQKFGAVHVDYSYSLCAVVFSWFSTGVSSYGWGLRTSNLGKRVGVLGRGWYRPKERSYRPSIVTFPLSLRFSEILPLLFCKRPLFPYPTSSLPPNFPMFPGNRWIAFWLQRAKALGYSLCS